MASKREQVLDAVEQLVRAALPFATVRRNGAKAENTGEPGGETVIRDGEPGEPEVDLSPLAYNYAHRIPIEITLAASDSRTLDEPLVAIGLACEADRTLGGLVDWIEPEAPTSDDLEAPGVESGRWAETAIVASYATANPLT